MAGRRRDVREHDGVGALTDETIEGASGVSVPIGETASGRGPMWWLAAGSAAFVMLPLLVAAMSRSGHHWFPTGDFALMDLRVRSVFSSDIPLVGPYSRYGWNHPGPIYFYAVAPFSLLAGGAAWATLVGSVMVHVAGVAIADLAARRAFGAGGVIAVNVVLALTYSGTGSWLILEPWNPHVALPYFVAFVAALLAVTAGARWWLAGVAVLGTVLVQTHVGYATLVLAALVWLGIVAGVQWAKHRPPARRWIGPVVVSAMASLLIWIPPAIDVLTQRPTNVSRLLDWFLDDHGTPLGLSGAASVLASYVRIPPPWFLGPVVQTSNGSVVGSNRIWILLAGIAVAATTAFAARRRDRPVLLAITLLAVLASVGLLSIARIVDTVHPYLFYWVTPLTIGLIVVGVIAWSRPLLQRPGVALGYAAWGLCICVIASFSSTRAVLRHPAQVRLDEHRVEALVDQALDHPLADRPFLVRQVDLFPDHYFALLNEASRRHLPVSVQDKDSFKTGRSMGASESEARSVWYPTTDGAVLDILSAKEGATIVAEQTPLPPSENAELRRLVRSVADRLDAVGRSDLVSALGSPLASLAVGSDVIADRAALDRIAELNAAVEGSRQCRCGVVALMPGTDVDDLLPVLHPPEAVQRANGGSGAGQGE